MKKRVFARILIGGPLGLALSFIIAILISLVKNDGIFYAVVPELVGDCGSELNAVILQSVLSILYGAAWAGASVIWEMENWSILKQTVVHLVICSIATFPIAYFTRWMSHTPAGIALYFGIFFGVYFIIWLYLYSTLKKRVKEINEGLGR